MKPGRAYLTVMNMLGVAAGLTLYNTDLIIGEALVLSLVCLTQMWATSAIWFWAKSYETVPRLGTRGLVLGPCNCPKLRIGWRNLHRYSYWSSWAARCLVLHMEGKMISNGPQLVSDERRGGRSSSQEWLRVTFVESGYVDYERADIGSYNTWGSDDHQSIVNYPRNPTWHNAQDSSFRQPSDWV